MDSIFGQIHVLAPEHTAARLVVPSNYNVYQVKKYRIFNVMHICSMSTMPLVKGTTPGPYLSGPWSFLINKNYGSDKSLADFSE